jgi:hypothetical protein
MSRRADVLLNTVITKDEVNNFEFPEPVARIAYLLRRRRSS